MRQPTDDVLAELRTGRRHDPSVDELSVEETKVRASEEGG
jgi:hypothetical protein